MYSLPILIGIHPIINPKGGLITMNENQNIHEAIEFILASLEKQGQAPGTIKNYLNSFHV
jgi:hypothetical protein